MKRRALLGRSHLYVALLAAGLTGALMMLCTTALFVDQGANLTRELIGGLLCAGLGAALALCLANILLTESLRPQRQMPDENGRYVSETRAAGLPDHYYFEARVSRCLRGAARQQERVALILIDSDHLDQHAEDLDEDDVDEVSIIFAERLRAQVRDRDLLARLGNGRFAVLLVPLQVREDAERIAEHILKSVQLPIYLSDGRSITPLLDIGIAQYPEDGLDTASLQCAAELMMQTARAKVCG